MHLVIARFHMEFTALLSWLAIIINSQPTIFDLIILWKRRQNAKILLFWIYMNTYRTYIVCLFYAVVDDKKSIEFDTFPFINKLLC